MKNKKNYLDILRLGKGLLLDKRQQLLCSTLTHVQAKNIIGENVDRFPWLSVLRFGAGSDYVL